MVATVSMLSMTSKTLYQWLTLCQCWPWPSNTVPMTTTESLLTMVSIVPILLMTTKTLYQWCSLCQCWSWSPNHCANDDQRSTLPVAHKFLSNPISTSAEQPVQFYTNHTSTAAEQPDNFKCIPTTWLEKTMARPYSFLQHKCRTVCQMLC